MRGDIRIGFFFSHFEGEYWINIKRISRKAVIFLWWFMK